MLLLNKSGSVEMFLVCCSSYVVFIYYFRIKQFTLSHVIFMFIASSVIFMFIVFTVILVYIVFTVILVYIFFQLGLC